MATTINVTQSNKLRPWQYVAKDIIKVLSNVEDSRASLEGIGLVQLSDSITSTTSPANTAATPKAVYDAIQSANDYAQDLVDAAVASAFKFKGTVTSVSALPAAGTAGLQPGDIYNIQNTVDGEQDGVNYVWVMEGDPAVGRWESLGGILKVETAINETTASSASPISVSGAKAYVDNSASTINARIDSEVSAINTTIDALAARVTEAESDIAAIETTLNAETTGVLAQLTDHDSRLDALEAGAPTAVTPKTGETSATINKDSDAVSIYHTSGTFALTFSAAQATEYAVKEIYLIADADTTLTVTGATFADAEENPVWGKTGYKLYLRCAFIAGDVVITVLDNSQEAYNADQYVSAL